MLPRLFKSFQSILERGPVWVAEVGTNTYHLYGAIAEVLTFIETTARSIALDSDPIATVDTIPEWQEDLKLPRCEDFGTDEDKRNEIIATLRQRPPINEDFIQDLADLYGIGDISTSIDGPWIVTISFNNPNVSKRAKCGTAMCGRDRLFEMLLNKNFFCHLKSLLPAHLQILYVFV